MPILGSEALLLTGGVTFCHWNITGNHRQTGVSFVALVNRFKPQV